MHDVRNQRKGAAHRLCGGVAGALGRSCVIGRCGMTFSIWTAMAIASETRTKEGAAGVASSSVSVR
jgi:hypothetical protein